MFTPHSNAHLFEQPSNSLKFVWALVQSMLLTLIIFPAILFVSLRIPIISERIL